MLNNHTFTQQDQGFWPVFFIHEVQASLDSHIGDPLPHQCIREDSSSLFIHALEDINRKVQEDEGLCCIPETFIN